MTQIYFLCSNTKKVFVGRDDEQLFLFVQRYSMAGYVRGPQAAELDQLSAVRFEA